MTTVAPSSPPVATTVVLRRWPDVLGFMPRVGDFPQAATRVLGVDLSHRRTGICVIVPEQGAVAVRAWSVGADLKEGAPLVLRWERMHLIAEAVLGAIWDHRITHVAFEGPAFGLGFGMHLLGELSGVVKEAVFTRASPRPDVVIVPPMQARKALLGRATKGKAPVGQYAKERWGIDLPPDEADAFALANWMWTRCASWGFGPTQAEIEEVARALRQGKKAQVSS